MTGNIGRHPELSLERATVARATTRFAGACVVIEDNRARACLLRVRDRSIECARAAAEQRNVATREPCERFLVAAAARRLYRRRDRAAAGETRHRPACLDRLAVKREHRRAEHVESLPFVRLDRHAVARAAHQVRHIVDRGEISRRARAAVAVALMVGIGVRDRLEMRQMMPKRSGPDALQELGLRIVVARPALRCRRRRRGGRYPTGGQNSGKRLLDHGMSPSAIARRRSIVSRWSLSKPISMP